MCQRLRIFLLFTTAMLTITSACYGQITKPPQVRIFGTWWPSARGGHSSTEEYAISRDAMWAFVLKALEDNQIDVTSKDLEQGVIDTAFLYPDTGRIVTNAVILVRRFSYRIHIVAIDATHAHVTVTPHVESASQMGWNRQPSTLDWSDVTDSAGYKSIVDVLKAWLYDQVEQAIH